MADPLSIGASVLAVATAAITSVRSLCDTVKSFQNRDKTLCRLQSKLSGLLTILESLAQVANTDASILPLLEIPIERCKDICKEFEQSMRKFKGKSKTSLLDWTKLEFMRGDINEFIGTIEGYESTIMVGLGTINMRDSKISHEVLQKYEEMIKETTYNLELHLQRIDEKLTALNTANIKSSSGSVDLQDERAVTLQCLQICEDASSYIESLTSKEFNLLKPAPQPDVGCTQEGFEAQMLVRKAFSSSQASLSEVIKSLGERLQSVVEGSGAGKEVERSRLQEDIAVSQKCLQVCKVAREISDQKIHNIGEAVAEEDSDQIVVTTLADLFTVKKAVSRGRSAQLVATITPENFNLVVEKRYNSRFATHTPDLSHSRIADTSPVATSQDGKQSVLLENGGDGPALRRETRRDRPNPNEMRKRHGDGGSER